MRKYSGKICLLLFLTAASLFWFLNGRPAIAESGADKDLTCSLKTEVPVGQVTDQLISTDQSTAVKVMTALEELDSFSGQAIKGAKDILTLEGSCSPSRCESDCQQTFVQKSGFPDLDNPSLCASGFTCSHYGPKEFLQAQTNNDPNIPPLGCENLPAGEVETFKNHWYEIVSWTENVGGNACDTPPDCGIYNCTEIPGNPVTGKTGNWMICGNPMTWRNADPGSLYNYYDVYQASTRIASCLVGCESYTGDSGECNIDWSEPACLANDCAGQACDFASLDHKASSVYSASAGAKAAYQKIEEVLYAKVAILPFIGNICQVPGLGVLCQFCWFSQIPIPGFTNILSGCKTEMETILGLHEKSLTNIRNCQTNPQNFFEDRTGKILLRCEELMPDLLKQCYPNNFYCCQ